MVVLTMATTLKLQKGDSVRIKDGDEDQAAGEVLVDGEDQQSATPSDIAEYTTITQTSGFARNGAKLHLNKPLFRFIENSGVSLNLEKHTNSPSSEVVASTKLSVGPIVRNAPGRNGLVSLHSTLMSGLRVDNTLSSRLPEKYAASTSFGGVATTVKWIMRISRQPSAFAKR